LNGCLICGSIVSGENIFCGECGRFALLLVRKCSRCGAFNLIPSDNRCFSCHGKKLYFDSIYSHYIYCGAVSTVISVMKYSRVRYYAEIIGANLAGNIPEEIIKGRTVIFPPMTFFDKFRRSFNQAEIIADKIALRHNLVFDNKLLKKARKTKPQASLTYAERQTNLKNAFKLTRPVENENFLIVDDVCTTFSTINTIAKLLKQNGAESVNAVTFARTSQYFS